MDRVAHNPIKDHVHALVCFSIDLKNMVTWLTWLDRLTVYPTPILEYVQHSHSVGP